MDAHNEKTWCPSSPPDRPEAVVLGVHAGSDGLVYLADPVPAREALDLVPPGVDPGQVIRFAGYCDTACKHRNGTGCGLVAKVTVAAPAVADSSVPRCHLRPHCQWWQQSGVDACRRCPLVRTVTYDPDEQMRRVGDPGVTPDSLLPS